MDKVMESLKKHWMYIVGGLALLLVGFFAFKKRKYIGRKYRSGRARFSGFRKRFSKFRRGYRMARSYGEGRRAAFRMGRRFGR